MSGIERLKDRQVKNASKPLNDGGNLWLIPRGNSKNWVFRFSLNKRSHSAGLGSYPITSLADARKTAAQYREWLKQKLNPIKQAAIHSASTEEVITPNFVQAAARYIQSKRRGWKNRKHAHQWVSTLRTYAKPVIGNKPVNQITTDDIEQVLRPIWETKTETAKRVQNRMEQVLDWATVKKHRIGDNPARWRDHLSEIFTEPSKLKKLKNGGEEKHLAAMPYEEVPALFQQLSSKAGAAPKALQYLILTACRTSEILEATWDEISIEERVWIIPARRMKAGKEHRVPLTDQMTTLLESLPRLNEYLFPGMKRGRPLSNMSMLVMVRKMGYAKDGPLPAYVPHGFRSSFRDWAEEEASYPNRVVEKALAHTVKSQTERAYQRRDLLEKRRNLMAEWGEYLSA